jgi:alginate O-acetyltransferase complex protein AlgI
MSFTTHIFVFYFLPGVLLVYYLLPGRRNLLRNVFLVLASAVFYAWLNPWFVVLMLAATMVNYVCGLLIGRPGIAQRTRVLVLAGSVLVNLGVLGFFKYFMFAQNSVNSVIAVFGAKAIPVLQIVLPVGVFRFRMLRFFLSADSVGPHPAVRNDRQQVAAGSAFRRAAC